MNIFNLLRGPDITRSGSYKAPGLCIHEVVHSVGIGQQAYSTLVETIRHETSQPVIDCLTDLYDNNSSYGPYTLAVLLNGSP